MSEGIAEVLYWLGGQFLRILGLLERMFDVFAGGAPVTFDGQQGYLTNLFFTNDSVSFLYLVFAGAGVALSVGFAAAAIVRKILDVGGVGGAVPLTRILRSLIISILLIGGTNTVITVTFNATNMFLSFVTYSSSIGGGGEKKIEFSDADRSAMARALNTLGNYSVNEAYDETLNINLCFNAMREELLYLQEQGVFDLDYAPEENGESWQSLLTAIARTHDLSADIDPLEENKSLKAAVLHGMEVLRTMETVEAFDTFTSKSSGESLDIKFDCLMFLMATMDSARNEKMNEEPSVTDSLRGDFFKGELSIYDEEAVKAAFDITRINWIIFFVTTLIAIGAFAVMLFNCIIRIFSMIFLYIISPAVFSTMPFDDGNRTREWIKMFLVQTLAVFATVIPMKLVMLFVPIILDDRLRLFESGYMDQMARLILLTGSFIAAGLASSTLSKLVANEGGRSAIGTAEIKMMGKTIGKSLKRTLRRAR